MAGRPNTEQQIIKMSELGGKHYGFATEHDPDRPIQYWFQHSDEGPILFLVFYTQACRWSKCLACNLPSRSSLHKIKFPSIIRQVDHLFGVPEIAARQSEIRKVIISNNGSVLDEETFSSQALMYLMTRISLHWTQVRTICLETRAEYVDQEELEWLARALREMERTTELELGIGFEAYDEEIRNDILKKGLILKTFENMTKQVAAYQFRLKCYLMQKPVPQLTDEAAIQDIHNAIDYLSSLAEELRVRINVHLNPTYVAAGTRLEESFREGRFTPPTLRDVARAVLHAENRPVSVFIGLNDEELTVPGGSFLRPDDGPRVALMEEFNRTGDFGKLRQVLE